MATDRSLCERHIAQLAAMEARLYSFDQHLTSFSTDFRRLSDLVQDHTRTIAEDRVRTRLLVGAISAAVGLIGALTPSIVQAFLR